MYTHIHSHANDQPSLSPLLTTSTDAEEKKRVCEHNTQFNRCSFTLLTTDWSIHILYHHLGNTISNRVNSTLKISQLEQRLLLKSNQNTPKSKLIRPQLRTSSSE